MRVVLQRVERASVEVDREVVGRIEHGLLALVGVGRRSTEDDAAHLADRTGRMRLFADGEAPMARSVADVGGEVLAISQFTLYGDTRKGTRPSFAEAADGERAEACYRAYCAALTVPSATGVFGALMRIEAVCDGPVTVELAREQGRSLPPAWKA